MHALMFVAGGILVLAGLLGCDESTRRPRHQAVYVEQPQYVVVRTAPPPVVVERQPPPPGPGYVWIDGYWNWNGREYDWQRGHWAVPPHGRAIWVRPRYEEHERGYRYMPGQWREDRPQRQREDEDRRGRH
jgi:hypothetical protein